MARQPPVAPDLEADCAQVAAAGQPTTTPRAATAPRPGQLRRVKCRSIWRVLSPYWLNKEERYGKTLVFFLFFIAILRSVVWSLWSTENLTKIQVAINPAAMDEAGFWWVMKLFMLSALPYMAICLALEPYWLSMVSLYWRRWMVAKYLNKYFTGRSYYNISQRTEQKIQNPDQRMDEDIREVTDKFVQLTYTFLCAGMGIATNMYLLARDPVMAIGLSVYVLVGSVITFFVGRPLVAKYRKMEDRNAALRYALVRVDENVEAIAFYGGHETEEGVLKGRLKRIVEMQTDVNRTTIYLNVCTGLYTTFVAFVPYLIGGIRYFNGQITYSFLLSSSMAFGAVVANASLLVANFGDIAILWARLARLGELMDAMEENCANEDEVEATDVAGCQLSMSAGILCLDNVAARTPNLVMPRTLYSGLNLTMKDGQSLLCMGPSGCGKSSLLRIVAKLWFAQQGTMRCRAITTDRMTGIARPTTKLFMPQKPYMVSGTLKAQMLYPTWEVDMEGRDPDSIRALGGPLRDELARAPCSPLSVHMQDSRPTDEELESVLNFVELQGLLDYVDDSEKKGLYASMDWNMLSGGEKQRLALTRAFLAKPDLLLLDESTSALDETIEEKIYQKFKDDGTTFISIGHRSTLRAFHTHLLDFQWEDEAHRTCMHTLAPLG